MSAPNVSDGAVKAAEEAARYFLSKIEYAVEGKDWAEACAAIITKHCPVGCAAPTVPAKFFEEMSNITGQDKVTAPAGDGALPEDVRSFIELVTLHLQSETNPFKREAMFHQAYALYEKYDVEGWRAKQRALTMPTGTGAQGEGEAT